MTDKDKVREMVQQAKDLAHNGQLQESLDLFKKAYDIIPSEKIKGRIQKLQEFITNIAASEDEEDEDEDEDEVDPNMVDIGNQFLLHKSIANNLYDYQKQGVLWFWKLFKKKHGGILGDDMGLGKTIQVIAFLAGMFDLELIKTVLIVAPVAVIVNWENELKKWAGGLRVKLFHGNNKKLRAKNLHKIQNSEGVLITTYGMVVSNVDSLCEDDDGGRFVWDYIILDEGHKIKNPTKTSKCVRAVPAKYHYILTGTPVQNNLSEMWSLFDFTQAGELLGTKKTFDTEFQKPIVRAREKDATSYEQEVGNKMADSLRQLIQPFFLRRIKAEIFNQKNKPQSDEVKSSPDDNKIKEEVDGISKKIPELKAKKFDLVIWVYLSDYQLKIYQDFVNSTRVKETLLTTRSPLAELNLLKKISDHPRLQSTLSKLLTNTEEQKTRLDCGLEIDDTMDEKVVDEPAHAPPVDVLVQDSGKMVFLVYLMDNLKKENHRTVIFSQSRKMLDIIQKVLSSMEHNILRIDGTITNPMEREKIIQKFQKDTNYNVLLMTTQVGNVGLTITSADRLVIFDPSWNPGTDAQAVDRVYRIGQTKDVVVYRLITCGSIEEKIYRKQIFKNAIMKQATGASNNPYRYFTNQELRELFVLDDPRVSTTQQQLKDMHQNDTFDNEDFLEHLKFLDNKSCTYGVSHHNLLFSQEAVNERVESVEIQEAIDAQETYMAFHSKKMRSEEVDVKIQVFLANQRVSQESNTMQIKEPKKRSRREKGTSQDVDVKNQVSTEVSPVSNTSSANDTSSTSSIIQSPTRDVHDISLQEIMEKSLKINDDSVSSATAAADESIDSSSHRLDDVSTTDDTINNSKELNTTEETNNQDRSGPNQDTSGPQDCSDVDNEVTNNDGTEDFQETSGVNSSNDKDENSRCNSETNKGDVSQNVESSSVDENDLEGSSTESSFTAAGYCANDSTGVVTITNPDTEAMEGSDMSYSPVRKATITPQFIRKLGSNYRTPPLSPFSGQQDRRGRREQRLLNANRISYSTPTEHFVNRAADSPGSPCSPIVENRLNLTEKSENGNNSELSVVDTACSPKESSNTRIDCSSNTNESMHSVVDMACSPLKPVGECLDVSYQDVVDTGCSPLHTSADNEEIKNATAKLNNTTTSVKDLGAQVISVDTPSSTIYTDDENIHEHSHGKTPISESDLSEHKTSSFFDHSNPGDSHKRKDEHIELENEGTMDNQVDLVDGDTVIVEDSLDGDYLGGAPTHHGDEPEENIGVVDDSCDSNISKHTTSVQRRLTSEDVKTTLDDVVLNGKDVTDGRSVVAADEQIADTLPLVTLDKKCLTKEQVSIRSVVTDENNIKYFAPFSSQELFSVDSNEFNVFKQKNRDSINSDLQSANTSGVSSQELISSNNDKYLLESTKISRKSDVSEGSERSTFDFDILRKNYQNEKNHSSLYRQSLERSNPSSSKNTTATSITSESSMGSTFDFGKLKRKSEAREKRKSAPATTSSRTTASRKSVLKDLNEIYHDPDQLADTLPVETVVNEKQVAEDHGDDDADEVVFKLSQHMDKIDITNEVNPYPDTLEKESEDTDDGFNFFRLERSVLATQKQKLQTKSTNVVESGKENEEERLEKQFPMRENEVEQNLVSDKENMKPGDPNEINKTADESTNDVLAALKDLQRLFNDSMNAEDLDEHLLIQIGKLKTKAKLW